MHVGDAAVTMRCRSDWANTEWEWEGMGINYGYWTGMGMRWWMNWEWEPKVNPAGLCSDPDAIPNFCVRCICPCVLSCSVIFCKEALETGTVCDRHSTFENFSRLLKKAYIYKWIEFCTKNLIYFWRWVLLRRFIVCLSFILSLWVSNLSYFSSTCNYLCVL